MNCDCCSKEIPFRSTHCENCGSITDLGAAHARKSNFKKFAEKSKNVNTDSKILGKKTMFSRAVDHLKFMRVMKY